MKIDYVKPANSKKESLYIFISIFLIVILAATLLRFNTYKKYEKSISSNQISSISLNNQEISIFTQLTLFGEEYQYLKEDNKQLSIDYLDKELFYSPFTKDSTWELSGKHEWNIIENNGFSYYIGNSSDLTISGNFIFKISEKDYSYTIFYSKEKLKLNKENIENEIKQHYLVVVSYTGNDFMKEAKGE